MRFANRNELWAHVIVEELARCGVRHVALSPGSRSTPLVLAFARDERFTMRAFLDERSAAYFALGVGRATGHPAVVLTTSGTAAANLLPAVVEAHEGHAPLLTLTADRPHHLRGADANQAIDQVKLFGDRVRLFADVAPPTITAPALRHLRQLACRAVAAAVGDPAGPVHLNVPFDKPLEPTSVPGDVPHGFEREHPLAAFGRPDGRPFTRIASTRAAATDEEIDRLARLVAGAPRGLIVCGPHERAQEVGPAALALARATGYPLLADPLSGTRFAPGAREHALGAYDLFLDEPGTVVALTPQLVLRVGDTPTSSAVAHYLENCNGARHIVVGGPARHRDHLALATDVVTGDPAHVCTRLAGRVERAADKGWTAQWRDAELRTRRVVERAIAGAFFEGAVAAEIAARVPADGLLFVGNSMPVRDLDAFAQPRDDAVRVLGNRGASGIDGVVSSALGAACVNEGPTVALLGDLSFLHDVNGLQALRDGAPDVTLVVVNNDGGGIFHFLPIAEHEPAFTRYFATPHGLDLARAAALHDVAHERVATREALGEALTRSIAGGDARIVEVTTDRAANHTRRAAVRRTVRDTLNATGGTP